MSLLRRFSSSLPLGDTEAPQEGFVDSIPYLPGIAHAQPPGCKSISLYTGSKQIAVMAPKPQVSKEAKALAASNSSKGKKKKWSKGKMKEKVNNQVLFDQPTYDKLLAEVPKYKLITQSVLSDRLRINGSLARAAIRELLEKNLIRSVAVHSTQSIYTRATNTDVEAAKPEKEGKGKKGKGKDKE